MSTVVFPARHELPAVLDTGRVVAPLPLDPPEPDVVPDVVPAPVEPPVPPSAPPDAPPGLEDRPKGRKKDKR